MRERAFAIEIVEGRIEIRFRGNLEEADLVGLVDEATSRLREVGNDFDLVVHLDEIEDCTIMARAQIIDAHGVLAPKARRVAFISNRSRFRGLALWVMRVAGDDRGRAFVDWEQARAWLAESDPVEPRQTRATATMSSFLRAGQGEG